MKIKRILIREDIKEFEIPVPYRIFSYSEIRTGIFNSLERLKFLEANATLYYDNPDKKFLKSFLARNEKIKEYNGEDVDYVQESGGFLPWELLANLSFRINEDVESHLDNLKWVNKFKLKPKNFDIFGKSKNLHIHQDALIYPNVVFDVSSGPIIVEKDVKISPFSFLEGPLYIGASSHIDNARITGGCIIGTSCRIGGEVENSIICDYTNKHHEGFLGHSFIGHWVNLGALTTTSDLKNNYGVVRIQFEDKHISTNTLKFGSIIGDFTKVGIGTMINTGSLIDTGSNIVSPRVSGYQKRFQWSDGSKYRLDKFISDSKKIMARRNQNLSSEMEENIKKIYEE